MIYHVAKTIHPEARFYRIGFCLNCVVAYLLVLEFAVLAFARIALRELHQFFLQKPINVCKNIPCDFAFYLGLSVIGIKLKTKFDFAAKNPKQSQEKLLASILRNNSNTDFAKDHKFTGIKSIEDFRKHVPIQTYDTLKPYINRHLHGEANVLVNDRPISYATTSGTTGEPKYIPITLEAKKKSHQDVSRLWSYQILRSFPQAFTGKILPIVSPAVEGHAPDGTEYGSTSGQLLRGLGPVIAKKYAVPYEVFEIEDYHARYYSLLVLSISEDVTLISSANPSTLKLLAEKGNEWKEQILADIAKGQLSNDISLPENIRKIVENRLKANPKLAARLENAYINDSEGLLRPTHYWPNLKVVACWTGGNSAVFLREMKKWFDDVNIHDLGYLASEMRGSIPMFSGDASGVLTVNDNFFEFCEVSDIESGSPKFLTIDEIQANHSYYIFITTKAGLYRYNINDIIEVTGFYYKTPTIRFVQKGKGVTNITGEKLYEQQLIQAVNNATSLVGLAVTFFMALANSEKAVYELYTEFDAIYAENATTKRFIDEVENQLKKLNMEYAAKRKSLRLNPLKLFVLGENAFESFKQCRIKQGIREAQIKSVPLTQDRELIEMLPIVETVAVG